MVCERFTKFVIFALNSLVIMTACMVLSAASCEEAHSECENSKMCLQEVCPATGEFWESVKQHYCNGDLVIYVRNGGCKVFPNQAGCGQSSQDPKRVLYTMNANKD